MTEHKIKIQDNARKINDKRYSVWLVCTCGRHVKGTGINSDSALRNAEKHFREHLPIR